MANLDRYGGAEAYARYDNERAGAEKSQLRRATCMRCAHAFAEFTACAACGAETMICVCLLDPADPQLTDPFESPADIGCEDYEEMS